jgi:hypothetical protein
MAGVSDQERGMTELKEALASSQCVISVMGEHAGEGANFIFDRKISDIEQTGKTFWLVRSPKARPAHVQKMCSTSPGYMIFIEPATKGGARPTIEAEAAKEYSHDRALWHRLPVGLSPVTGKLDTGATALVFDTLTANVSGVLNTACTSNADSKGNDDAEAPHFRDDIRKGLSPVCSKSGTQESYERRS